MTPEEFRKSLLGKIESNRNVIEDKEGNWIVKGFVDTNGILYTISTDTKVVSKILEIQLFPILNQFAQENEMEIILAPHQNYYPDITFRMKDGTLYAVDIKSTYRVSNDEINGFTLGAYKGYFRDRQGRKNITFPYAQYKKHFVLGIIYSRDNGVVDERNTMKIDDLLNAPSVLSDFQFLLHEKYKLASTNKGSGNTANIGSIKNINNLINGNGVFNSEEKFDEYWLNYE